MAVSISNLSVSIHLLSVSAWIGLMLFFLSVFAPAVHRLNPGHAVPVLNKGREYFQSISSALVVAVLLTGIMAFAGRTVGSAGVDAVFNWILGIKVFLFAAMSVHHVLQVAKYSPKLIHLAAQTPPDSQTWPQPLLSLWHRWFMLLKINAVLGTFTLLLGLFLKSR